MKIGLHCGTDLIYKLEIISMNYSLFSIAVHTKK